MLKKRFFYWKLKVICALRMSPHWSCSLENLPAYQILLFNSEYNISLLFEISWNIWYKAFFFPQRESFVRYICPIMCPQFRSYKLQHREITIQNHIAIYKTSLALVQHPSVYINCWSHFIIPKMLRRISTKWIRIVFDKFTFCWLSSQQDWIRENNEGVAKGVFRKPKGLCGLDPIVHKSQADKIAPSERRWIESLKPWMKFCIQPEKEWHFLKIVITETK